jgi:SAM-dependent methyltransferase
MRLNEIRAAYDLVAEDYLATLRHELAAKPFDRIGLSAFADVVSGPVVEAGCGPGRITAHLRSLGVDARGTDLSPAMVELARRTYPGLRFDVGAMTALDEPDGGLGGVVSWYSIVHTPAAELPAVFAEFARVLVRGGHVLVAFKAGNEVRRLSHAYGHDVALDVHWHPVDTVAAAMAGAGITELARLVRPADEREKGPQAWLVGRLAEPGHEAADGGAGHGEGR